jgi:hypothetical protein
MRKDYARVARAIGKVLGARREAVASDPLPQRLAELLCRLADKENERKRSDAQADLKSIRTA